MATKMETLQEKLAKLQGDIEAEAQREAVATATAEVRDTFSKAIQAARFRLFDSVTIFLKNAAQSQPLMLVLNDLHWADKSSLMLLQFPARELTPAESGRP